MIEIPLTRGKYTIIDDVDAGLENPYITLLGFTTPVTFNDLMSFEQATNGFMARAMIFRRCSCNWAMQLYFEQWRAW